MVLPILGGILGAGLLTQLVTHGAVIPAYNRRQGNRMQGILDDLGPDAGMDQQIRALAMGGILSPRESLDLFSSRGFGDYTAQRDFGYDMRHLNRQYDLMDRNAARAFGRDFQAGSVQAIDGMLGTGAGTYGIGLGGEELSQAIDMAGTAIGNMESGGNYGALGPVITNGGMYDGDRAYGKYQVMGRNIPEWTEKHVGVRMTPEEFLADPVAQETVFRGEFGRNMQQHGFANAASIWHSGRDLKTAAAAGAQDGNMATVDYVRSVSGGLSNVAGLDAQERARFTPELRTEALQTENALRVGQNVLDYASNTTLAGRKADPRMLAQMRSEMETTLFPAMQKMIEAGALQEAEIELFERWMGDPLGLNFTERDFGKLEGLLNTLQRSMNTKLAGAGVDYQVNRQGDGPPEPVVPIGRLSQGLAGPVNRAQVQNNPQATQPSFRNPNNDWLYEFMFGEER